MYDLVDSDSFSTFSLPFYAFPFPSLSLPSSPLSSPPLPSSPFISSSSLDNSHEGKVDICAATINFERSLLAFTLKDQINGETVYDTFVAEIQPAGRVFTLNLTGTEFRKIQFMQTDSSVPRSRSSKASMQSRLLLIMPRTFVLLYTFKLQTLDDGVTLNKQPEQEVVAEDLCWYQWDPAMQWLYHAKFESSTPFTGGNSIFLTCTSFTQQHPDVILTIALPLPYEIERHVGSETYYSSPLALFLPVREVNLQVLHRREGFWCVCLQHSRGVSLEETGDSSDAPEGKLEYTVYIIHNGHMLFMQVPLPTPCIEPMDIHFMLLGSFVVAYIPQVFLHLLNVGPSTDPCHHLAFGATISPKFPSLPALEGTVVPEEPVLSSSISLSYSSNYSASVIECQSSVIYDASINTSAFLELFKTADNIEIMEDILHLMIIVLRHHAMAHVMMEHVCQSPMRLGDHRLFAEFLVSFAYTNSNIDCGRYIAKQLPLTMTPTYRGRVFKNAEGTRFAMLQVTPIRSILNQLLVQSDQRLVKAKAEELMSCELGEHPLELLCFIAVTSQLSISRISITSELDTSNKKQALLNRPLPPTPPQLQRKKSNKAWRSESTKETQPAHGNLLDRISSFTRPKLRNTVNPTSSPDAVSFLEPDHDLDKELEHRATTIRSFINSKLCQNLSTTRSKTIAGQTASLYCSELDRHSAMLLRLVWDSLGFSTNSHPLSLPVYRIPTAKEEILFQLLEAYHLAHLDIGLPTPSGFQTLFTTLGFVCLSETLFLQYLRNGVFVPTTRFVSHLLEDVSEEKEHIVHEVLCHLDHSDPMQAFQQWDHPTINTLRRAAADT